MRRFLSLLNLIFTTIFLSGAALILYPFDRTGEKINGMGRLWAILHLKVCGIGVNLDGAGHIPATPCIVMCNHQSTLDIFALLASLPLPCKWIAKKELFSVPFLGWALKAGKNISLDRENPRKALKSIHEAVCRIREGMSVIIFPEGTWGNDGELLPFKKGGFSLALRAGVPIIPVGVKGTGKLQPEGYSVPRCKGSVSISIGKPICMDNWDARSKTALMHEVRSSIKGLAGPGKG